MSSNDPSSGNKLSDSELSIQVKFLQSVLQNASVEDEAAGDNLAELLKQLDEAHGVAQGVEDKLDKILENLEGMIGDLEGNKVQWPVSSRST